jgi:hypothetical protein
MLVLSGLVFLMTLRVSLEVGMITPLTELALLGQSVS